MVSVRFSLYRESDPSRHIDIDYDVPRSPEAGESFFAWIGEKQFEGKVTAFGWLRLNGAGVNEVRLRAEVLMPDDYMEIAK